MAGAEPGSRGRAERPLHHPRRHRLRPPRLLRQPDRHPQSRRARRRWAPIQQHAHDRAVFAVALVFHDRAQPSLERHVLHHGRIDRLSGRQRQHSVRERDALGNPAAERLQHLRPWQVASHALRADLGGGPLRPLAARSRLRALLRLPRRRYAPVLPGARARQQPDRTRQDAGRGLSPDARSRQQGQGDDRRFEAGRAEQALFHVFLPGRDACAPSRAEGMGRQVQGQVRRRVGRLPRAGVRQAEETGDHPRCDEAFAPRPRRAGLEQALRRRAAPLCADDGGVRRLS